MTLRLTFFIAAVLFFRVGIAQLFGDQQIISAQADGAADVYVADLDDDGDMDVLSASAIDGKLAWYENLGGGIIGSQQIIYAPSIGFRCVRTADFDADGDLDVLSASAGDDQLAWYANLGGGQFGAPQVISTQAYSTHSCHAADLDGDGDMDVLSVSSYPSYRLFWHPNLGEGIFGARQIITYDIAGVSRVDSADLDNDGDMDVLINISSENKVAWYENLGGGIFGTQLIISTEMDIAKCVHSADLDGDGDIDVLSASGGDNKIAWYMNLGDGNFSNQQIISTEASFAAWVYTADLNSDGNLDVLSASMNDDKIACYMNLGAGVFSAQRIISTEADNAYCVHAADLDGDGDMDVLSASFDDDKIAWYANIGSCMDPLACNYQPNAIIDDGSCCYSNCGCTDPIAANFSPAATCPDGSCIYQEGCTNELATNYNPDASMDDGSCRFRITGTVFFDENQNGIMDGIDYGLPFQTVEVVQTGQSYITNDEGHFIAIVSQQQLTSFELINPNTFPYNTTSNPRLFNTSSSTSTQLMFGVSNTLPIFAITTDFYPDGFSFLCDDYTNFNICFRNLGNYPIDGIIELEIDPLFQGYQEVTPIDSVNGNTIYMSYQNLLPGQMFFYNIELLTPTVDHIGEFITNTAHVYGYYQGNQVAYGEKIRTMQITCAFDPNDKQAYPLGYTDDHLLLQQTEQEFVIRFQNTGNAPAQDIRIQDTLDVNFDIASFRLIANSHSVMTTVDPQTRLIDFYFENIQLPDSVNNEPQSHGVISYVITPNAGLPVGTVLENTAYIYFDNNDPIVTNTTWTTIHECGGEAAFEPVAMLICDEPQVNFESSSDLVEHYTWYVDGLVTGSNSELLLSSIINPEYEVTLTASNPLCTETNTLNYIVPDIASIDPCIADLNCDGFRSTQDLLVIISEFGCGSDCQADIDDNGMVNVVDLFIFVSLYELSCWD